MAAQGNAITVYNGAGFDLKFRVKWGDGSTDWTAGYPAGKDKTISLREQTSQPPEGAEMWPEIQALVGGDHRKECARAIFHAENDTKVHYNVAGGYLNISCDQG